MSSLARPKAYTHVSALRVCARERKPRSAPSSSTTPNLCAETASMCTTAPSEPLAQLRNVGPTPRRQCENQPRISPASVSPPGGRS
eukprot:CAMPEP_0183339808 /NCGR_PEP_ID=MMETSP0164_2-20130417/6603_1 /TAXON_ID=221442 /ORGANISM="Coccolithus pelagicus ssp braarudi, Strain PLY182g" /LENGTH=85 /DNA_ID=CAMNT_0025509871 /DNA_START=234 /DNA_END=488 /DNA_ORIENTATION=+